MPKPNLSLVSSTTAKKNNSKTSNAKKKKALKKSVPLKENYWTEIFRKQYPAKIDSFFADKRLVQGNNSFLVNLRFNISFDNNGNLRTSGLQVREVNDYRIITDMDFGMKYLVDFSLPITQGNRVNLLFKNEDKNSEDIQGTHGFFISGDSKKIVIRNNEGKQEYNIEKIVGIGRITGYFQYHLFPAKGLLRKENKTN